jgi:hypothetical protein
MVSRAVQTASCATSVAGMCPICRRHDAVRQLPALYADRARTRAEPPIVTRYGLIMRGAALLATVPRYGYRVPPPQRPSMVGAYVGLSGLQVPLAALALLLGAVALVEAGPMVELGVSLAIAFLAGLVGDPLRERGARRWAQQTAAWEHAMQVWRGLRYCTRCDQIFQREPPRGK